MEIKGLSAERTTRRVGAWVTEAPHDRISVLVSWPRN